MRTLVLAAFAFVVPLTLLASGCTQNADPVTSASADAKVDVIASKAADTNGKSDLVVGEPRLVLPAVHDRPGAVYFTLANTGGGSETLIAVSVAGSRQAQMHETSGGSMAAVRTVTVPPHGTTAFAPGGRHVMVFGLPATARAGGSSQLTLTFADRRKITVALPILAPGTGGHDDMAGMTMDH